MSPNYVTIITPLIGDAETCKQYLRENAEPEFDLAHAELRCKQSYQFDKIACLHFCSFIILDEAAGGFLPSLIFEATFDGEKDDFLLELLSVAPQGMHEIFRHCEGYPESGTPELIKEYLLRHDVGANIFFSGSPGRIASQIRDENRLRAKIVFFLSTRSDLPSQLTALNVVIKKFVRRCEEIRWAEQPATIPWEVKERVGIIAAVVVAVWFLALSIGFFVGLATGFGPERIYGLIPPWFESVGYFGAEIDAAIPSVNKIASFVKPATLHMLTGLTAAWLLFRITELFLSSWSRDPRDQRFLRRFLLHLAEILRYVLVAIVAGVVVLSVVSGKARPITLTTVTWTVMQLSLLGFTILVLKHYETSLRLVAQFQPVSLKRENIRQLALDLVRFGLVIAISIGILLVATLIPAVFYSKLANLVRSLVYGYLLVVFFTTLGILFGYLAGVFGFALVRALELKDEMKLQAAAGLIECASKNVRKYRREEGGINRYQNHLASITNVKPGLLRRWLLRLTLFAINLLSRFWFNRGELGGIPTILSARWVMIDRGQRLLFLDNYGGAWDSYLNEFIDLAAVKGLNAIWSNTFLNVGGKQYNFPQTRFLFWLGAQDEPAFKAYVRQSQIETIAWYSSHSKLSVVNINENTELRQSLFKELPLSAADEFIQNI